jgi:hypothetical protein
VPNPQLDRRALLRNGGLAISMGALVAACGSNRTGVDAPGRLGVAEPVAQLEDEPVDDVVLLRTAQSLEYTALDVYAAAAATGALSAGQLALVGRFVADHTRHAAEVGALIDGLDGEQFQCANPFLVERAVTPILAALDGTDDIVRDLLNISYALEEFAGRSYQSLVGALSPGELRREAMRIGSEELRHASGMAAVINPDQLISPTLTGGTEVPDADGFAIPYAVPSQFGLLTGVQLVVGAADPVDGRFTISLQTPAQNTFVYGSATCPS